jgi:hypothetical protein
VHGTSVRHELVRTSFVGADVMGSDADRYESRGRDRPFFFFVFFCFFDSCGRVQGLENAVFCVNGRQRWRGGDGTGAL